MTRKQIEHKLKNHNLDPVERETLNQLLHHRIAQETSAKRSKKNFTHKNNRKPSIDS